MSTSVDNCTGGACECGHRDVKHRGIAECMVHGCKCSQYHHTDTGNQHGHRCECCDREYQCSHPQCKPNHYMGICNICAKEITGKYPGDLIPYLFGVKGDSIVDVIRAKKLAMDMVAAKVDVKQVFEFWLSNKG